MNTTKTAGPGTFGTSVPVGVTILAAFAALMAITMVAGVGAGDAQAAMSNAKQRDAIVGHAYYMLKVGVPYKPPGSGSCDMSGASPECLNRLSYAKAGIKLPYCRTGQIEAGRFTSSPIRGDLMLIDTNADSDYRDSSDYVGVYVGDGYFIQQSSRLGKTAKTHRASVAAYSPYRFVSVVPYN